MKPLLLIRNLFRYINGDLPNKEGTELHNYITDNFLEKKEIFDKCLKISRLFVELRQYYDFLTNKEILTLKECYYHYYDPTLTWEEIDDLAFSAFADRLKSDFDLPTDRDEETEAEIAEIVDNYIKKKEEEPTHVKEFRAMLNHIHDKYCLSTYSKPHTEKLNLSRLAIYDVRDISHMYNFYPNYGKTKVYHYTIIYYGS